MDAAETFTADQEQARQRAFATSLGRDVAAYYLALTGAGVPDDLAGQMALRFNDGWLASHVEAQAGVFDFAGLFGGDE